MTLTMILFYSEFCQHCTVLLETIKRHDKNNMIKLVSIDLLRSLQKPIDPRIHSVPALLLVNSKEYLFGKNVFDYLLLPNRGVLFSTQNTRDINKSTNESVTNANTSETNMNNTQGEPLAFSLGAISAEHFSSIDEKDTFLLNDKNYNWDVISDTAASIASTVNEIPQIGQSVTSITDRLETLDMKNSDTGKKSELPSMEEIMKQRANDII